MFDQTDTALVGNKHAVYIANISELIYLYEIFVTQCHQVEVLICCC